MACLGSKNRKQQSAAEEEDKTGASDKTSDNKNEVEWIVKSGVPDANLENTEEYPVFIMQVMEVYTKKATNRNLSSTFSNHSTKNVVHMSTRDGWIFSIIIVGIQKETYGYNTKGFINLDEMEQEDKKWKSIPS